ncbi:MAG: hypothetical protein HONBIEJF_02821 [Fimbriimonadaceae bacterium]|nr:hypothetical protein [Fimbriimonadaceae bacterium]
MGTAMALPLLEGMAPLRSLAGSLAAPAPVRMAFLFVPNGIKMDDWTPPAVGALEKLPHILEPLAGVKDSFNILTGLAQHNAFALGDGPGDHARSTATWLTGVHIKKTSGSDIRNGISADQVAAAEIGDLTKFASLEIGCERGAQSGDCDSGYSCAYSSSIAWKGEAQPLAKEVNPRLVFERLFGSGDSGEQEESRSRRARYRKSILDFVLDDAKSLEARLGTRDKQKLDEYLTGIREIEARLVKAEKESGNPMVGVPRPSGTPRDYAEHIRLMGDMMILAFQTDVTRICTFMFANDGSNRSYSQIGIADGHHDVSHHGRDVAKLEKKRQIDRYHAEQLAYILERMQSIKEGNGTLLDNTLLVYGAGISDGDRHNHDDLPILLAGSAGGSLKTGRHLQFTHNTPMNNLFLSMLDRVGVKVEKLGDSTGKLQGLF